MIVTKVRGQNKIGKILVSPTEAMVVRKMGINLEVYVQMQLTAIAKRRKWKWFFEKKVEAHE